VISVKPGSGEQGPRGSTVAIVVSKGPETVPVPDVVGLSVVDAAKAIEAAGLTVSGTSGSPTKKVTASNPAAGTVVKRAPASSCRPTPATRPAPPDHGQALMPTGGADRPVK
jgi:serine/threonine-protein kinase